MSKDRRSRAQKGRDTKKRGHQAQGPKRFRAAEKFMNFPVKQEMPLMQFLMDVAMHGISRQVAKSYLSHRQVYVDKEVVSQWDFLLKPGQLVRISRTRGHQEITHQSFKVVYEDAYLLVIDKKAGIATKTPAYSRETSVYDVLLRLLQRRNRQHKLFTVNRLERDCSGLLIMAKDEKTKDNLVKEWYDLVREFRFVAVLDGKLKNAKGQVSSWLDENREPQVSFAPNRMNYEDITCTKYTRIKESTHPEDPNRPITLVELDPEWTIRNQMRFHMERLMCPILDEPRLHLHCFKLGFYHPVTKEWMEYENFYPQIFKQMF